MSQGIRALLIGVAVIVAAAFASVPPLSYVLLNLAPLTPMLLLAAGSVYWLRASRWAWIAAGLVATLVPGIILTWYLRDVGFDAYGGVCTREKARGFMEAMQWVFMAQGVAGVVGAAILGGLAVKKNHIVGAIMMLALIGVSLVTGYLIYFAAGMTAVDGYAC